MEISACSRSKTVSIDCMPDYLLSTCTAMTHVRLRTISELSQKSSSYFPADHKTIKFKKAILEIAFWARPI